MSWCSLAHKVVHPIILEPAMIFLPSSAKCRGATIPKQAAHGIAPERVEHSGFRVKGFRV